MWYLEDLTYHLDVNITLLASIVATKYCLKNAFKPAKNKKTFEFIAFLCLAASF